MKYHKRRNKAIKILNTKIPTDPYKMAIFPVGIPCSLQKPKNPYRRDFSLRVGTLVSYLAENWMQDTVLFVLRNRQLEILVVETLLELLCELNYIGQQIFNISP